MAARRRRRSKSTSEHAVVFVGGSPLSETLAAAEEEEVVAAQEEERSGGGGGGGDDDAAQTERLLAIWLEREAAASAALEAADALASEEGGEAQLDAAGWAAIVAAQKARLAYRAQKRLAKARAREAAAAAEDGNEVAEVTARMEQLKVRRRKREKGFRGGAQAFLWGVNRDVLAFVASGDSQGMLPPMERMQRGCARRLAACHGVVAREMGSDGARRPLLLQRTDHTREAPHGSVAAIIAEIARQHESTTSAGRSPSPHAACVSPSPHAACVSPAPSGGSNKREKTKARKSQGPAATPHVVGAGADPLWEDSGNIGNQMLRKLGWTPGGGLGAQEQGIQEPLCAVVKKDRHGLGLSC